ncbi:MAG: futalosine hydrolase [Desulfovibrionales bacterium]
MKKIPGRVLLVTVAAPAERKAVLRHAEGPLESGAYCIQGTSFQVLETGIGPVNAAYKLGRWIGENKGRIRGVVNLGVAGGFDLNQLPLLSTVIVAREIWPEIGLRHGDRVDPCGIGLSMGSSPAGAVWDRIELEPAKNAAAMGIELPRKWPSVSGTTVAGVTGTLQGAERVHKAYPTDVESMEGFALGWVCMQEEVPFVQCRVISNRVGSREEWNLKGALRELGEAGKQLLKSKKNGFSDD